jgi:hypothetical protein
MSIIQKISTLTRALLQSSKKVGPLNAYEFTVDAGKHWHTITLERVTNIVKAAGADVGQALHELGCGNEVGLRKVEGVFRTVIRPKLNIL